MLDAKAAHSSYSWKHDPLFWAYSILMFLPIITFFVFYNYYTLDFLVYTGWILLVFSVVIILMAGGEFRKKGRAPKGRSVVYTTAVVDSGIYAVVRHPQYLGFILFVFALVLMSQHARNYNVIWEVKNADKENWNSPQTSEKGCWTWWTDRGQYQWFSRCSNTQKGYRD